MIKIDWFPRYRTPKDQYLQIMQSWDTANKGGQQNAYSVCITFGRTENVHHILHVLRQRMNIPDLRRTIESHYKTLWGPANGVIIEEAASGIALVQQLRAETSIPVLAWIPTQDKVTRMDVETPAIEAGKLLLPEIADWLPDFEGEIRDFPGSAYKDQADALSQYLAWVRTGSSDDWFLH